MSVRLTRLKGNLLAHNNSSSSRLDRIMPPRPDRSSSHPNLVSRDHSFHESDNEWRYYDTAKRIKEPVSEKSIHGPQQSARRGSSSRSLSAPPEPFQERWTDERVDSILVMNDHHFSSIDPILSVTDDRAALQEHQQATGGIALAAALLARAERSGTWGIGIEEVPLEYDAVSSPFTCDATANTLLRQSLQQHRSKIQNTRTATTIAAAGKGDETIAALHARGVRGGGLVKAATANTVPVIRPQPVKTTAPSVASGTLLVAPQARTAARSIEEDHRFDKILEEEEEAGTLQSTTITTEEGCIQEEVKTNSSPIASATKGSEKKPSAPAPPPPSSSSEQSKPAASSQTSHAERESWCKQATDQSKQQEELQQQRKQEAAERERKRQQLQCDFPSSPKGFSHYTRMPPTSGELPDGGDPHGENNGEAHENTPQEARRNNRPHHAHHRSTPGRAVDHKHGGGGASRRATDDEDAVAATTATVAASIHPPTPLFERLVTEEVQELKAYARIIESQNRRLAELEHAHGDLETRLQVESKSRQKLEATLESREREWTYRLDQLESDRDHWRNRVDEEQTKNDRLMEEIMRKEQEIRKMLQRKYDHEGSRSGRGARGMPSERGEKAHHATTSRSPELHRPNFQSPHEILRQSGSADAARLRNSRSLLLDFFGM